MPDTAITLCLLNPFRISSSESSRRSSSEITARTVFSERRGVTVTLKSEMKYKFRSVVLCFLFSTSTRRSPVAIFFAFKLSSRILSRTLWTRNRDSLEKDLSDSEYHQKSRELATVQWCYRLITSVRFLFRSRYRVFFRVPIRRKGSSHLDRPTRHGAPQGDAQEIVKDWRQPPDTRPQRRV